MELQREKQTYDGKVNEIKAEMNRLKALIVADMGTNPSAVAEDGCTITWKPSYTPGIFKEGLERLKVVHPDIYQEYVTYSERRNFNVKQPKPEAA